MDFSEKRRHEGVLLMEIPDKVWNCVLDNDLFQAVRMLRDRMTLEVAVATVNRMRAMLGM